MLSSEWDSMWQSLNHCFISPLGHHFSGANGRWQTPCSWWAAPVNTVAAVHAELPQMWVSWLAAASLLRCRGDSISKLIRDDLFCCESAACSTRVGSHRILPASMAPPSIQYLWAEKSLSFKAANWLFAPCMRQQLLAHAVTLTCFFLSSSSAYALKWNSVSNVRDALHLVLDLFCAGSVTETKRTRRLNTILTERKYTV